MDASGGVAAVTFLGLTAEGWTAVSTLFLAGATCILVGVGAFQIRSIREEATKTRTLEACNRYESDPVLDLCLRRLFDARRSGEFQKEPGAFKPDVATVLNYLDSIACGIEQGLYIEALARDHIEPIVKIHVNQFLPRNGPDIEGVDRANYHRLITLYNQWSAEPPRFVERKR